MAASFFGCSIPMVLSRRVDFRIQQNTLSKWKYNYTSIQSIVCVSHFIKTVLEKDLKKLDRIKVVHSGIDLQRFTFKNTGILRKEFNIAPSIKIVANVAAIAPHKDYFTFVDVAKSLPQYNFIIIGDGPLENEIKSYAKEKEVNNIIFTGFLSNIEKYLKSLDCFLITSETEGLGTSILDAMICKIPVVGTRAGGIPEIVIHEKTGLIAEIRDVVELSKSVEMLMEDQELASELINNAYSNISQNFSKEVTANKTLEIYQQSQNDQ